MGKISEISRSRVSKKSLGQLCSLVGAQIAQLHVHEGKEKRTFGLFGSKRGILRGHKLAIDPAMRCFLPKYGRYVCAYFSAF